MARNVLVLWEWNLWFCRWLIGMVSFIRWMWKIKDWILLCEKWICFWKRCPYLYNQSNLQSDKYLRFINLGENVSNVDSINIYYKFFIFLFLNMTNFKLISQITSQLHHYTVSPTPLNYRYGAIVTDSCFSSSPTMAAASVTPFTFHDILPWLKSTTVSTLSPSLNPLPSLI